MAAQSRSPLQIRRQLFRIAWLKAGYIASTSRFLQLRMQICLLPCAHGRMSRAFGWVALATMPLLRVVMARIARIAALALDIEDTLMCIAANMYTIPTC